MSIQLLTIAILLLLSAFFSGSETAFFSLSQLKLSQMEKSNNPTSRLVVQLLKNPERLLITILVGNMLVNVAVSSLGENIVFHLFQSRMSLFIAVPIMTFLILVFGEITPKAIAIEVPELISSIVAIPINIFSLLIAPILKIIKFITSFFFKIFHVNPSLIFPIITQEEIKTAIDISYKEGTIDKFEKDILNRIFSFGNKSVRQVMTPRKDIVSIEQNETIEKAILFFKQKGYSRMPVYSKDPNNIIGIVGIRDLISANPNTPIKPYIRQAYFVPETKKISSLFTEFQRQKKQFAIVIDEFGDVAGLVTMEDLLEEIIGSISDIKQTVKYKRLASNLFLIEASMKISDFNHLIGVNFESKDAQTIGGFLMDRLGHIPQKGEKFRIDKLEFEILEATEQKPLLLKVKMLKR